VPFDLGLELGLVWEKQTYPLASGGVLAVQKLMPFCCKQR